MKRPYRFFLSDLDKPRLKDPEQVNAIFKRKRLAVMSAITIGYAFYYTCRLALSVVKKPLLDAGIFTAADLGNIGSAFLYTYAFGKFFNGFISDYLNMKKVLPAVLILSALINLIMGKVLLLGLWILLWGINGWFQGFGSPGSVVSMSQWFSNNERGRFYGIWSTAHSMGEGLTFLLTAALVSALGWRAGFYGPGFFCLFVAVPMYLALADRPQTLGLPSVADWRNDHGDVVHAVNGQEPTIAQSQRQIFKMVPIWILGLASATMYVTRYAINSWGILYLQETKQYSLVEAGGVLGLNTIAGIAGCVTYGFISDKLFHARRPPATLIFGVLEVVALLIIFALPLENPVLLTAAFALYGFTLSGILAAVGGLFATDIAPKRVAGAVMGFIGVFSYLGAAVQEQISGYLIDQSTTIVNGVRHYDFTHAIYFWVGSSVVSLMLATTLWRVKAAE